MIFLISSSSSATAKITRNKSKYKESNVSDGFFSVPSLTTDYEIEYSVNGKKYFKYVSESDTGGRAHGKLRIKY